MPAPYKRCNTCCTDYTREEWERLKLLAIDETGEWRNCTCTSTLLIPRGDAMEVLNAR